jgi:hypothetical protein
MDEVVRALHWQRIAPPFPVGGDSIKVSDEILTDSWIFRSGQTWQNNLVDIRVLQGARAVLARNIDLPEVHAGAEKPFVFAARFPNGAVAIGVQERTVDDSAWHMPRCDVNLFVSDAMGPYAVFGDFNSLTLNFDRPIGQKRLLAQDLAGDEAVDITSAVQGSGRSLHLSGEMIRRIGLDNATPGDLSSPGLVLVLR